MKVLMFGWEFPPKIYGGLAVASYGITKMCIRDRKGKQKDRVVFMGNSITEGWVANDAAFFEDNGYVEMCIRDRFSSK